MRLSRTTCYWKMFLGKWAVPDMAEHIAARLRYLDVSDLGVCYQERFCHVMRQCVVFAVDFN